MATSDVGIRLSVAGRREATAGLKDTEEGLEHVGQAAENAGKKAESSGRKWEKFKGGMGVIGRGLAYTAGVIATVTVAAGAMGLKTAASMEQAKIGFTTMLGSGKKATTFLKGLSDFAAKTPFEFPELQTAASSLVSAGINADKVIPIMTTLGDVTAGMGTGSEGIKRATVALQQMNAAGKITGEDLNQLRDAGIPVYDLLSKAMGQTKADVVALAQEGKLGGVELAQMMKALETGKGLEKFNGLMKKQSKSLTGTWSTLKDTVNMGLAKAVKPALPLVKDLVNVASDLAEKAMPHLKRGVKGAVGGLRDLIDTYKAGGFKAVWASLTGGASKGSGTALASIATGFGSIGDAMGRVDWAAVKDNLGEGTSDTISVFAVAIGFAADHIDELAGYLPMLVAGFVAYKAAQALGSLAALAAVPITLIQIASNFTLAASLRAATAATATNTGVERTSLVGKIAHNAATVAQGVATKAVAAGQWLLNAAMTANPIGLVIAAIALLVGGFILLYKNSETFRGVIDGLWNNVLKPFGKFIGSILLGYVKLLAKGWLMVGRFGLMAFRMLVTGAIKAFDGILAAAEAGLGWVPGLGDKIKGARVAFDRFGDATINKLKGVEDKLRDASTAVDNLGKKRATIDITTRYTTVGSPTRGRPDEYGTPSTPGSSGGNGGGGGKNPPSTRLIIPTVPVPSTGSVETFEDAPMPTTGGTDIYLDGKKITEATLDRVTAKVSRQ